MTPYELRFEIFKQAYNILSDEFHTEYETARCWNEDIKNKIKMDYPSFPKLSDVLNQAEVINNFVSERQ